MKIYVVTSGEYSDTRVEGVCSTKELAELVSKLKGSDNTPIEFELNDVPAHPPGLFYYNVMFEDTGDLAFYNLRDVEYADRQDLPDKDSLGDYYVWAKDKEHAIKIASERWTRDKLLEREGMLKDGKILKVKKEDEANLK